MESSDSPAPGKSWEAPDKSFSRVIIQEGYSFNMPLQGSTCRLSILSDDEKIIPLPEGQEFKTVIIGDISSEIEFVLERCLWTMKEGEICDLSFVLPLRVPPPYVPRADYLMDGKKKNNPTDHAPESPSGPGQPENALQEVSPNGTGDAERKEDNGKSYKVRVQLVSFTREPAIFEMSITEKWRRACWHRERGVTLFNENKLRWAFTHFSTAFKYIVSLEHDIPVEDQSEEIGMDIKGLKLNCFLNLAACQLKNGTYHYVVANCTRALEIDPSSAKALYRRGAALIQLQDYERAKADLERAAEIQPKNPALEKQMALLKERMQKLDKYFATAMKKMFE
ncbi:uncharacterized protein LOC135368691 [Ornithodoros turicata]|uniref:uncharacterized protein LOC135368691 n=1 Tax=Ornithodoros turicata TaxID=34597 RepID=UPI0031390498